MGVKVVKFHVEENFLSKALNGNRSGGSLQRRNELVTLLDFANNQQAGQGHKGCEQSVGAFSIGEIQGLLKT
jgi:hypothetical protein